MGGGAGLFAALVTASCSLFCLSISDIDISPFLSSSFDLLSCNFILSAMGSNVY